MKNINSPAANCNRSVSSGKTYISFILYIRWETNFSKTESYNVPGIDTNRNIGWSVSFRDAVMQLMMQVPAKMLTLLGKTDMTGIRHGMTDFFLNVTLKFNISTMSYIHSGHWFIAGNNL